jgi:hypothetical protein
MSELWREKSFESGIVGYLLRTPVASLTLKQTIEEFTGIAYLRKCTSLLSSHPAQFAMEK